MCTQSYLIFMLLFAGIQVGLNIYGIHHKPEVWTNPEVKYSYQDVHVYIVLVNNA